MQWRWICVFALAAGSVAATAQSLDDLNVQVRGYATQGFLYSDHNSAFYTNSSSGSPAWTEAVVNLSLQPRPQLAIGVQARYQLLGSTGNSITLDWTAADYKVGERLGVRFGKVKTPWGLFNETQDIDPSYMWALLPQSIYDITTRNADLSHYGGVAYGAVRIGSPGTVDYRLWGGEQVIPADDGQFDDLNLSGNGPTGPLAFGTYGGALHWRLPLPGLMLGASDGRANKASVTLHGGTQSFAPWNNLSYFGCYDRRKLMLAAEWNRQGSPGTLLLDGESTSADSDARGWYGMATWKLSEKLIAGVYHSQFFDRDAPLGNDRFSKDWTISARYDVNEFIYLKAEEHFVHGTALSLDPAHNSGTIQSRFDLTALKIGVSF